MKEISLKFENSILLFVGEGNFSFARSFATSPQFSELNCHLIASDYVPEYKNELEEISGLELEDANVKEVQIKRESFQLTLLKENVKILKSLRHNVFFDVDAAKLDEHKELLSVCCSKKLFLPKLIVIFNFPHVKSKKMKIGLNRDLLRDFFRSCDKLYHLLMTPEESDHQKPLSKFDVVPVVSLCAGQSGIQEVETTSRCWGDSWQINDMAAHGNFVCTSVSKFEDWNLLQFTNHGTSTIKECNNEESNQCRERGPQSTSSYQSSYYRLQSGVSFTTESALTLTYNHREHIDPFNTSRLESILKFSKEQFGKDNDVVKTFQKFFMPITKEKLVARSDVFLEYQNNTRPYFHLISSSHEFDMKMILNYFKCGEDNYGIDVSNIRIKVDVNGESDNIVAELSPRESSKEKVVTLIGKVKKNKTFELYADVFLELKYKCNYQTLLSPKNLDNKVSLYPHVHEFHISFWLSDRFTMDSFVSVLLDVYGLMLKSIQFVEEYEDSKSEKKSVCWKVQIQSLELPLSRHIAHQMYLHLRKELSDRLCVVVR